MGFDNTASKPLENVVDAFIEPGRLPGGLWTLEETQWK